MLQALKLLMLEVVGVAAVRLIPITCAVAVVVSLHLYARQSQVHVVEVFPVACANFYRML